MSKGVKITISVIFIFFILLFIAVSVYFYWPWNKKFFEEASQEFEIPGLDTEFVPQGITSTGFYPYILISGYMNDNSPSRFYLLNDETKEVIKYFTLKFYDQDNNVYIPYKGHAGGVTAFDVTVWTVSKEDGRGYIFRFLMQDVEKVENGGEVVIQDYTESYNNADFCFVNNKVLYVGEYYKSNKYETVSYHHKTTRSGEINHAMIYGYDIDQSRSYGLYDENPDIAISVRDLCQGIAINENGNFIISTSYGIADSNIYYYKDILNEEPHSHFKLGIKPEIPLYFLDNQALIKTVNIPSMSEEMFIDNNRLYVLFESACKKYKLYNRKKLKNVYSLPLNFFEK